VLTRPAKAILLVCLCAVAGCSVAARPAMPAPLPAQGVPASQGAPATLAATVRPGGSPPATAHPGSTPSVPAAASRTPPASGPSRPAVTPSGPAGEGRWTIEAVDLRLEMPSDWRGLLGDDLDAFAEIPAVAEAIGDIGDVTLVFAGIDQAAGSNEAIGGSVNVMDVGDPVPDRALVPLAEVFAAGLEATEGVQGQVRVGSESLPVAPAATVSYTVAGDASTGGVATDIDMYLFVTGDHLVLVTFTAPTRRDGDAYGGLDSIIRSIRAI